MPAGKASQRVTQVLPAAFIFLSRVTGVHSIRRHLGATDPVVGQKVDACFALPGLIFDGEEIGYGHGKCPNLINCVYSALAAADQAGLSAGTAIASLLPTILALIGAGPLELVQLAFASPIRAAATCLFGVGLPSGLFRQLRPGSGHSEIEGTTDPCTRTWQIYIPQTQASRLEISRRVAADMVIVGLAGVMLWRNWIIGSATMVTFRCEYSWLLFCWPMACLMWLVLACVSLYCMSEHINITLDGHHQSFWQILILPYHRNNILRSNPHVLPLTATDSPAPTPRLHQESILPAGSVQTANEDNATILKDTSEQQTTQEVGQGRRRRQSVRHKKSPPDALDLPDTPPLSGATLTFHDLTKDPSSAGLRSAAGIPGRSFTVTITMRKEAFWQWYEAGIETVAVGVYLYATIVLGSTLFLTGEMSIEYVVMMVLSLAVIRILGNVL